MSAAVKKGSCVAQTVAFCFRPSPLEPQYVTEGSRPCHSGTFIILGCRHLKNSKCREWLSLNSPYLHKDRSSKRKPVVINFLPGDLRISATEKDELLSQNSYHRRLKVDTTPRQTSSQTIILLTYVHKLVFLLLIFYYRGLS